MPYIHSDLVAQVKQIDLLAFLQAYDPDELVHVAGNEYSTKAHESKDQQCDMAAKKMIVARLMRAVRVSRDYQVEIELNVDCEQLGISLGSGDEVTALLAA